MTRLYVWRPSINRKSWRANFSVAVLTLITLTTVGQAAAVDNGTLGIRPATESDFFHISLFPGAAIDATALVINHTSGPVTLLTYPVDGQSTPQGGFALGSQKDRRTGIGAWVSLKADHINVPANTEMKVPFRLSVPVGTPPGDYAGGVIIQSPPAQGQTTTVNGGTAVRLDIVQRQGVRIYLKVAGTAINSLKRGALTWKKAGSTITFTVPINNTGNTILNPSALLKISGRIGAHTNIKFNTVDALLPGAKINLHASFTSAPRIEFGNARASITSAAGNSYVQSKFFYAPWTLLVIALLLLIALIFLGWRVARVFRRARHIIANPPTNTELKERSHKVKDPAHDLTALHEIPTLKARVVAQSKRTDFRSLELAGLLKAHSHEDSAVPYTPRIGDARRISNQKMLMAAIEKTRGIPQITLSRASSHIAASFEEESAHLVSTWARIMRRNPHLNISTLDEKPNSHVGVALIVESKYGLAIPVFKDPDLATYPELLAWINSTRVKSCAGKIPVEMLSGATTSILDLSEIENSTAISWLLPSQTTALSIGAPRGPRAESEICLTVDLRHCDVLEADNLLDELIGAL